MRHPQTPKLLVGTRWTRQGSGRLRHHEVVSFTRREGTVSLRPVLAPDEPVEIPWRDLRDRTRWVPGWVSVVEPDETSE